MVVAERAERFFELALGGARCCEQLGSLLARCCEFLGGLAGDGCLGECLFELLELFSKLGWRPSLGPVLIDQVDKLNAGDVAHLVVSRNGVQIALSVRLGSLIDNAVADAAPPNDYTITTI